MRLDKDRESDLLNSIKRFFGEELEMAIGDQEAARVVDFFVGELGPGIYDQAIEDAQAFFMERVSDLAGAHGEAEFNYFNKR
jgi:uncharacterized protein (DUF2164 family)